MTHPYASAAYARSLAHCGTPFEVPEWGCHVLSRPLPQGGADACGAYPVAVFAADAQVAPGLERLRRAGFVSVTLVLDDFHRPPLGELERHFDVCRPFKTHYVRRRAKPFAYRKHHRYEVSRARRSVVVDLFPLDRHMADWRALYATLTARHALTGVHDFPNLHHEALPAVEGVTAMGAWAQGTLVSAHVWIRHEGHVHSHLAASTPDGYSRGAAYAVYDASVAHFPDAEIITFGGGAGYGDDPDDGLARFKKGFANDCAPAYLCGAVLDPARYRCLSRARGAPPGTSFFPTYRAPEG